MQSAFWFWKAVFAERSRDPVPNVVLSVFDPPPGGAVPEQSVPQCWQPGAEPAGQRQFQVSSRTELRQRHWNTPRHSVMQFNSLWNHVVHDETVQFTVTHSNTQCNLLWNTAETPWNTVDYATELSKWNTATCRDNINTEALFRQWNTEVHCNTTEAPLNKCRYII